jgi:hypothetical protein
MAMLGDLLTAPLRPQFEGVLDGSPLVSVCAWQTMLAVRAGGIQLCVSEPAFPDLAFDFREASQTGTSVPVEACVASIVFPLSPTIRIPSF